MITYLKVIINKIKNVQFYNNVKRLQEKCLKNVQINFYNYLNNIYPDTHLPFAFSCNFMEMWIFLIRLVYVYFSITIPSSSSSIYLRRAIFGLFEENFLALFGTVVFEFT